MELKVALIIGANRGIGLKLVQILVERGWTVVGTIRPQSREDPSTEDLRSTGARVLELDYMDANSISNAAKEYGSGPLDLLINSGAAGPNELTWESHTAEMLSEMFQINVIGPFLATKAFYPSLKKSVAGKIINVAGGAGRFNSYSGLSLGYRLSKSALHQQSLTVARELQQQGDNNITVVALHPGHLATKMSNYTKTYDADVNVAGMVDVIEKVDISHTGCLLNWAFEVIPW